jgi:hypothetical protein
MNYTVIGVWLDNAPIVVGVITGRHAVHGGDDTAFTDGLWATFVDATDIEHAEHLAVTAMQDSVEHYVSQPDNAQPDVS